MGWFLRLSRGRVHMIYSQQAEQSCGIASIIMINFKMKKWQLAAAAALGTFSPGLGGPAMNAALGSAVKAEKEVYAAYAKVTGQPYDGSKPSDMFQLAKVMNELGIGNWVVQQYSGNELGKKIGQCVSGPGSAPIMVHVWWRTNSGHFIVCDEAAREGNDTVADFCDPWDASVRTLSISSGGAIEYPVNTNTGSIDFGGSHHDYSQAKVGDFSGWIAYRTN